MAHADVVEVHKTEHHIITIFYDPRPENPIQACDYFGTFYMWHKHYQLGNQNPYKTPKAFLADTHNANCENNFDGVILPISMTDHSGLTLNIGAPQDSWDSGRVGYICVSRLDCIKEGYNIVNNEDKEKVVERLENTINVLNDYLLGKVYFYQITTRTNTEIVEEQSGGHVGEIKDCVESALERAKEMDREYEMTMWKDPWNVVITGGKNGIVYEVYGKDITTKEKPVSIPYLTDLIEYLSSKGVKSFKLSKGTFYDAMGGDDIHVI